MEKFLSVNNAEEVRQLFGTFDENVRLVEKELGVRIRSRAHDLTIRGSKIKVERAFGVLTGLLNEIREGRRPLKSDIHLLLKSMKHTNKEKLMFNKENNYHKSNHSFREKEISPKTKGQLAYVEAIRNYDIVFGIGPAGTGKTYLAMAMAVEALKNSSVRRIILTRPAIEAGESLGYLPGDMYEKISPYLRPLYDALYDMMEVERIDKYLEMGIIEVAPLAYMRGRTLNDAFVILDEAQNCTTDQMKMFLTRLGFDSKAVVAGDITQSDLPEGRPVGLIQAEKLLSKIEGIKFAYFSAKDVVRHELVQKIIEVYEKAHKSRE